MGDNLERAVQFIRSFEMEKAIPFLKEEIKENSSPEAYMYLGEFYMNGLGVERNDESAFKYTIEAVKGGSAHAMNNLGLMYKQGLGIAKNDSKAFEFFNKSYAGGYKLAGIHVAMALEDGIGTTQDVKKAVEIYTSLSTDLSLYAVLYLACHRLGLIYMDGKADVPQDLQKARFLLLRAFDCDSKKYLDDIEKLIDINTKLNDKESMFAIMRGRYNINNPSGFVMEGLMYMKGSFVKQKPKKALKTFLNGYKKYKNPECAYYVGYCYLNGIGTIANIEIAKEYLKIASDGGLNKAEELIKEVGL